MRPGPLFGRLADEFLEARMQRRRRGGDVGVAIAGLGNLDSFDAHGKMRVGKADDANRVERQAGRARDQRRKRIRQRLRRVL